MSIFSIFSDIDHYAKATFADLVPASMRAELGDFAHAIVSNIVYDARKLGYELEKLGVEDIEIIWGTVKRVAVQIGPTVLADAFSGNIAKAVSQLGSAEVQAVLPQLRMVGRTTLQTMMNAAASMVVSGVLKGNPTLAQASSPAVSSVASSGASSRA